jgi:hypothetical protein
VCVSAAAVNRAIRTGLRPGRDQRRQAADMLREHAHASQIHCCPQGCRDGAQVGALRLPAGSQDQCMLV